MENKILYIQCFDSAIWSSYKTYKRILENAEYFLNYALSSQYAKKYKDQPHWVVKIKK